MNDEPRAGACDPEPRYPVAVRSLCEFTAKAGDLAIRFTPAPTALQGMIGHGVAAGRRGPGYQREVPLRGCYKTLDVRGRADGYDPVANRLEEFKTHRGDLGRMADNQRALHWAQLRIYGALLCVARSLPDLVLALVYFDVDSQRETVFEECASSAKLQAHFAGHCERFLSWASMETRHRAARDRFLENLAFPLDGLRTSQRRMAEAVYRCALREGALMVQAPTGIGKTLGTLFPLLKSAPRQRLDKVFFLVAKTSGRRLALRALEQLRRGAEAAPLRVLELVSKAGACPHPGTPCDAAHCPLARGFYDRLPAAREAALARGTLDQDTVREVAARAPICPYHLTHELARWCDVIVGDYNYYFDSSAILHGLTVQNHWRIGLLVDEAHNLLPRARGMYGATLDPPVLEAALRSAFPAAKEPLRRVLRSWSALHRAQARDYQVYGAIDPGFIASLQRATSAIADGIAREEAGATDEALLRFHFDAQHFCRMADAFGLHSLFDVTTAGPQARVCIRNVSPAPFLAPRFAAGTTSVLFSATLSPPDFYRSLLGLPAASAWIDVESPFGPHQLEVRVERRISTRFRDRTGSVRPIVDVMIRQYRAQPGNYLAFFSSFDYLRSVLGAFTARAPEVAVWEQIRGMAAGERDAFLANFSPDGRGIGFAVLGGVFAEGIDLPGDRLIGAFIATLGLPQVNDVNAEIERRMQALFGAGYEFTYLYPGLQKVVQAAGRVIRTVNDRGTVVLIDDRYMGSQVRRLLPGWWTIRCP